MDNPGASNHPFVAWIRNDLGTLIRDTGDASSAAQKVNGCAVAEPSGSPGGSAGLAALNWALHTKNAAVPLPAIGEPLFAPTLFDAGVLLVFCLPAALIVSRQPRNPVGWLLAAIGFGTGVADLAVEYGFYAVVTAPGSLPGGVLVAWLADAIPGLLIFGPVPLSRSWPKASVRRPR